MEERSVREIVRGAGERSGGARRAGQSFLAGRRLRALRHCRAGRCFRGLPLLLLCLALAFSSAGCGEKTAEPVPSEEPGRSGRLRIGIVFDSFLAERWERDREIFTSAANALGADVIVGNANSDAERQAEIVDQMVSDGIPVIVIVPVDSSTLVRPVERAHAAGAKVIAYDRMIQNAAPDLYVTFDSGLAGKYMAKTLNERLPEHGSYLVLCGSGTDHNVSLMNHGFSSVIRSDLRCLSSVYCENWSDEAAYEYLDRHQEFLRRADAVVCGNDMIAEQAVKALAEIRRAGQVVITGQDADLGACQNIVRGTQTMTVYKPIELEAGNAARAAVQFAKGEKVEAVRTVRDGNREIPALSFDPVLVTRENLDDTVIKDGFHLKEEVYLN